MQIIKPSLARGTRDFGPELMAKRKYIFNIIEGVFRQYGYQPLETPAMENLSTLTGKYGEEGDRLIFKILNSGDYLKEVDENAFGAAKANQSRSFTALVSEKALRYDLTVPLARYVSMNRHALAFPFKRYQIQPVWRADRPQKGRYREFYQCDADVIGSSSLFNEAELIAIYVTVFKKLGFKDFRVKVNNRKLFKAFKDSLEYKGPINEFITGLDLFDKGGEEVVKEHWKKAGVSSNQADFMFTLISEDWEYDRVLNDASILVRENFQDDEFKLGIQEIKELFQYFEKLLSIEDVLKHVRFAPTLARGLDYYTGTIMEVITREVQMGSIGGGGRYDNLTGIFGVDGLTGVGISFGAERILDVMEQLQLFPESVQRSSDVLLYLFDIAQFEYATSILRQLRGAGMAAELYLDAGKMKKAFSYAEAKNIPYIALIGDQEEAKHNVMLKDIRSGQQEAITTKLLAQHLKNAL